MNKFEDFQSHLNELNIVGKGKFDAWVETIKTEKVGKATADGFHLCNLKYEANFSFENCNQDPVAIFALVMMWLSDNDPQRRNGREGEPTFNATPVGKGLYHIDIQINFIDEIYVSKSETGTFDFRGEKWVGGKAALNGPTEIALKYND
jgi:hypothetical protein